MARYALMLALGLSALVSGCGGGDAGITPLMGAARVGALAKMRELLDEGADLEETDYRNGWTALHHAVHKGQTDAARLLLDRGANPNHTAGRMTPLMMAAAERDPAMLELLLSHGAKTRDPDSGRSPALSIAVSGGALMDIDRPLFGGCHPATVRALLKHDPTLTLSDREALFWARFHGCDEVLTLVGQRAQGKGH